MWHQEQHPPQNIKHHIKNKLDGWRSHIPKSNSSKGIWKWLPKFRDRKWSSKGAEEFFLSGTWSGFESRGRAWELSSHLTHLVGPTRAGGAPRAGALHQVPFSPCLLFCFVLLPGGSSVQKNDLGIFWWFLKEIFYVKFFRTQKLLKNWKEIIKGIKC